MVRARLRGLLACRAEAGGLASILSGGGTASTSLTGEKHGGFLCNESHVWSLGFPILVIFEAL